MSTEAVYHILNINAAYKSASSGGIYSYMAKTGIAKPYTILYASDPSDPIQSKGNAVSQEWRDVVVACYASSPSTAKSLAAQARILLDNFSGTSNGVRVKQCKYEGVDEDSYNRELEKAIVELRFRMCIVL